MLFIFISGLTSTASAYHFSKFLIFSIWAYSQTASPFHFFYSLSFTRLDLLSITSQTHFYHFIFSFFHFFIWTYSPLPVKLISIIFFHFIFLLIWTYSLLPVKLIRIHLPGLTFECQFGLRFDFVALVYLIGLTPLMPDLLGFKALWKILDLTKLSSFVRRSFWSFYGCETLFHSTSLFQMSKQISDAMRHVMYDRATNEMSEHFFFFLHFNECEMQMSYANAMIGLINALCNHYAPICYW